MVEAVGECAVILDDQGAAVTVLYLHLPFVVLPVVAEAYRAGAIRCNSGNGCGAATLSGLALKLRPAKVCGPRGVMFRMGGVPWPWFPVVVAGTVAREAWARQVFLATGLILLGFGDSPKISEGVVDAR